MCLQAAERFAGKVGWLNSDVHIELGKKYALLQPMQRRQRPGIVFTTDGYSSRGEQDEPEGNAYEAGGHCRDSTAKWTGKPAPFIGRNAKPATVFGD
jgi:hypothetical protein